MEKIIRENVFQQKKKKLELIGLALIGPSNNLAPIRNRLSGQLNKKPRALIRAFVVHRLHRFLSLLSGSFFNPISRLKISFTILYFVSRFRFQVLFPGTGTSQANDGKNNLTEYSIKMIMIMIK